jgi:type IV pilus assembly protein PilO
METEALIKKIEMIKMPIRILILAGTVVLFIGVFIWLIYIPKTSEIKKNTTTIEDLTKQLNMAKIEQKKLPERRAEKENVDAQFQEALKLLPNSKEIPSLLKKISELGNESQLDVRLVRPKKESSKEFYVEMPVAIEVRGTYHDIAVFFDKVGHMERIMNIQNVSMKPEKERSTTLITTCDATTYRFKGN